MLKKSILILCLISVGIVPVYAALPPDVKAQFVLLRREIDNLRRSEPGFLSRTASSIFSSVISTAVTGLIVIVGSHFLLSAYGKSKDGQPKKGPNSKDSNLSDLKALERILKPQQKVAFTFKDLAGSIPQDVLEVTEFIKDTNKFTEMGAKMPKGILLVGPPGVGKTSIARAIAGECKAYFIAISASEIIGTFVGDGPRHIRELFAQARLAISSGIAKKTIIFIDELDSIGGSRYAVFDAADAEYRNTLNELLNQMDGFTLDESIFVLAATNREKDIDTALKRPGRFDRVVEITLPNALSREAILKLYAKSIKHNNEIDFGSIARQTQGMSGADLKNIVNEAAIFAVRDKAKETTYEHFEKVLREKPLRNR